MASNESRVINEAVADAAFKWSELRPWRDEFETVHGHNARPRLFIGKNAILVGDEERPENIPSSAEDAFECPICHELLFRPVVLACGHTFCTECLKDLTRVAVGSSAHKCPTCRRPFHLQSPADVKHCTDFERLLQLAFPAAYESRAAEVAELSKHRTAAAENLTVEGIGIFVLEPLLPSQRLHLHVFEPRYRRLMRQALEGSGKFAMVADIRSTPLTFTLVEIQESQPLPDGRYNITAMGRQLFRAGSVEPGGEGFMVASGTAIDLDAEDAAALSLVCEPEEERERQGEVVAPERSLGEATSGESDHPHGTSGGAEGEAQAAAASAALLLSQSEELEGLVERWCALVRQGRHERTRHHLSGVLDGLGPMPRAALPSRRALWCAALINPLPGLGVAREIRPAMIAAVSPCERISVARVAIVDSIAQLEAVNKSAWRRLLLAVLTGRIPLKVVLSVLIIAAALLFECLKGKIALPVTGSEVGVDNSTAGGSLSS